MGATLPWFHHGLHERSFQDRKTRSDPEGVALPAHGVTMGVLEFATVRSCHPEADEFGTQEMPQTAGGLPAFLGAFAIPTQPADRAL